MPAARRKIPPQRKAQSIPGRKTRQPSMKGDEKASITKAARDVAKEVNGELEKLRESLPSKKYSTPEARRAANRKRAAQKRRQAAREGREMGKICAGLTFKGTPCQLPVLIKENWDGPNEPTGLYCLHHDPNITRDETDSFRLTGSANRPIPRRVTPGELAHQLIQRSPHHFLAPYLKGLGLKLTDDGELIRVGTGLKLHGFSRGGQVIRSPFPDIPGQVQISEKLLDRVYGKARQAMDLAAMSTTVQVVVQMDPDRVDKVAGVLAASGVLDMVTGNGNGNGNGNGHHEEISEVVDGEVLDG